MTDYKEEIDEFAPAKPETITAKAAKPETITAKAAKPEIAANPPAAEQASSVEESKPANETEEYRNAYESIVKEQSEQIAALIAQNESLTSQITHLIKNGAQITQQTTQQPANPLSNIMNPSLASNEDWSLESLAKDIGKREKR